MKKRIIVFSLIFVVIMAVSTAIAFASTTTTSKYTSSTYYHNSRFDNMIFVDGIDVSDWQENVDWKKVKASGIDFAIIRIAARGYGEKGNMFADSQYSKHIKGAKDAGLMVGVYFFSQAVTEEEAVEEAEKTLEFLDGEELDLPVFMDYEFAGGSSGRLYAAKLSKKQMTKNAEAFCNTIKDAGYDAGLYANYTFLTKNVDGKSLSKKYVIWAAQYYKKCEYQYAYDIWQYSSDGHLSGINGRVDCDYWYLEETPKATQANSIANCSITTTECLYNGSKNYEPTVKVKYGDTTLTEGVDYTVGYINNREPGTAYAYVAGKGEYADYKLAPFKIEKVQAGNGLITPTVSTANDRNGHITLSWNQVPDAEKYEVFRATEKDGTFQLYTTTKYSSFTHSRAAIGKTYYYKVRAIGTADGSQVISDMSETVQCADRSRLAIPVVTAVNNSKGQIQLEWPKVPAAEKYEIYRSGYEDGTYQLYTTTNSLSFADSGASKGKTYYYKVRAVDANGAAVKSDFSEIAKGSDKTLLATPTVKSANNSDGYIRITWNKVSGAEKYEVYRAGYKNGTYNLYSTTAGTSMTDTKAGKGATYKYKIRAVDGNGTAAKSSFSSTVKGTDIRRLASPSVKAASAGYNSIKVSWGKVTGATGYVVYRSTSAKGKYSAVANTTKLSYIHSGRTTGKPYFYKVKAYRTVNNVRKYGSDSSVVSGKAIPATPVITAKNAGSKKVKITWKKVAGATGYDVYRATSKSGTYKRVTTIARSSAVSYTNTKLRRGKTYFYKVRAYKTVNGKKVYSSYSSVKYAKG